MSDNLMSDNLIPDNLQTKKGHLSRQPIPNKLTQKNYLNYIFRLSDYKNSDFQHLVNYQ